MLTQIYLLKCDLCQAEEILREEPKNTRLCRNCLFGNKKTELKIGSIAFDSLSEMKFYRYCKDQKVKILRNKRAFPYECCGEVHMYIPDFKIGKQYIEIKGDNFFSNPGDKTSRLIDPSNRKSKKQPKCKQDLMKKMNVTIILSSEVDKLLEGKLSLEKFGIN